MPTDPQPKPSATELSLHEMLRIMDEARALRTDRELIERELNREQEIAALRERLWATTQVTGESATPEEVDAAIRIYYENLHTFEPPQRGFQLLLAHLYIRRVWLLGLLLSGGAILCFFWFLFFRTNAPLSSTALAHRRVVALVSQIDAVDRQIAGVATVPVEQDRTLPALQQTEDLPGLEQLLAARQELLEQLGQEYQVRIPSGSGERSGVDRIYSDGTEERTSGYYLILKAIGRNGRPERVQVHDLEQDKTAFAERWGERVPEEVYRRILQDKEADGIVDENLFATKQRGELEWRIQMNDSSGQPLRRTGQILDIPD